MKKIILIVVLMLCGFFEIEAQVIVNNIYQFEQDIPQSNGRGFILWRHQTDEPDFPVYDKQIIGFTDSTKFWINALKSNKASVNTNVRISGIATDGSLQPFDLSVIQSQTLTLNSNTLSIAPGNSIVIPIYITPTPTSATRAINGATFQVSATKQAFVVYTVRIACNNTLLLSSAGGTVALQFSINSGSSWVDVSQVENGLNVGLVGSNSQASNVSGYIPANAIVRMVTTIATGVGIGSTTVTYVRGQETY